MSHAEANRRFAAQIGVAADVFSRPVVVLELPPGQERRDDAVAAFALGANMLARLFSNVHLVAPDAPMGTNAWGLVSLRDLVDPLNSVSAGRVEWATLIESADVAIGVGAPPTVPAKRSTFAAFNKWEAALDCPLAGAEPGPFGALFAVCYAVAQGFLYAVSLAGGELPLVKPFRLSLLDYKPGGANAPTPNQVDLGIVHLVGVGAVGCAMIYALAHVPALAGELHLIDNDTLDARSNLNRYVLMRRTDDNRRKTDVAVEALRGRALRCVPHPVSFEEFKTIDQRPIDLLITPVDSEAGRRALAKHLPRSILNAATGNSTVTISRHGFADGRACLQCLYLPAEEHMTTEKRLATDMGLGLAEVEALLANNTPVSPTLVRRVEQHRGLEPGSLKEHEGKHVQSLYQQAVCSTAAVTVGTETIVSPLSFISAAAGVLLAAELVKLRTPGLASFALDNYFRIDTFYAPNPSFRQIKQQDRSGRCICADEDYVETYQARFPPEPNIRADEHG